MKLKELLRLGNLNTCLLTIVGYCKMEKYEYLTDDYIGRHFDMKGNLKKLKMITLEPWWVDVMDKEVISYSIRYDKELKEKIFTVRIYKGEPKKRWSVTDAILNILTDIDKNLELLEDSINDGIDGIYYNIKNLSSYFN